MKEDARKAIDAHRLMRSERAGGVAVHPEVNVADTRTIAREQREHLKRRCIVHVVVFVLAYVFTAGIGLLGVLLWVRPEAPLSLVIVGLLASFVFVACFAVLRMLVVHRLLNEQRNPEEDPGLSHHLGKSVAYGFVALVVAVLCTGFLVNMVSAFS